MEPGTTIRIATLNVHTWADAKWVDNVDRVIELLSNRSLDIVALQEAKGKRSPGAVRKVAEALSLPHHVAHGEMAVLSRYRITRVELVARQGGGRIVCEVRGGRPHTAVAAFSRMVAATVATPVALTLVAVHLDYAREPVRARELARVFGATPRGAAAVLLGDLNAVRRADYGDAAWAAVGAVRARAAWEAPTSAVMDGLAAAGWADARALAPAAARAGALATSRFDTRVDYVLANARARRAYAVAACEHVATDATDHALVIADFTMRTDAQLRDEAGGEG